MKRTNVNATVNAAAPALPSPILQSDLQMPKDYKLLAKEPYDNYKYTSFGGYIEFEIWYTQRFGWCIPTLDIRQVSGRQRNAGIETRRTYAVTLKGELVSMGMGPHVLAHHTVHVKASRLEALRPFLDKRIEGAAKAGECRDRISTRRANTIARRSQFGGFPW